eukprot:1718623-Pyramimonas_sp.AAC.1
MVDDRSSNFRLLAPSGALRPIAAKGNVHSGIALPDGPNSKTYNSSVSHAISRRLYATPTQRLYRAASQGDRLPHRTVLSRQRLRRQMKRFEGNSGPRCPCGNRCWKGPHEAELMEDNQAVVK